MGHHIERDNKRFKDIIRGRIKRSFKGYIVQRELIIPRGKDSFALPVPRINLPRFTYGDKIGGVGQGDGDFGDSIFDDDPQNKGNKTGHVQHPIELEVSLDELVQMLCESLELPRLKNKGKKDIQHISHKYTGISRVGPRSLAHFKRSYKEALKRSLIEQTYKPGLPPTIRSGDFRYKAPKLAFMPDPSAVIFYLMDVSGSMNDDKKELVRLQSFWIDAYLRSNYKSIKSRYIVHDEKAWEVDRESFYRIRSGGGTKMSSPIDLSDKIIHDDYNPAEWNIYLFQFSDGDNINETDTRYCIDRLKAMLPYINQYAYSEVGGGGVDWFSVLVAHTFEKEEKVALAKVANKAQCIPALKTFLGKGN